MIYESGLFFTITFATIFIYLNPKIMSGEYEDVHPGKLLLLILFVISSWLGIYIVTIIGITKLIKSKFIKTKE